MRLSELFTRTSKTVPANETAKNAKLLIQAGYIHKEMAGVYAFLPLGKRVLDNIVQIIREEMNSIGGQEVSMTALQNRELWEKTDRWDDSKVDNWFKTEIASGGQTGLGITHEEPVTNMMKAFISSYKDLPAYPYQFQVKFRNELRAKSGLMRGREFLMKDLYSFSRSRADHELFYADITAAYERVFKRLGIGDITYKTFASGGIFAKYSHEFQTLSQVGEDTIYVHEAKRLAINKEVYSDKVLEELGIKKADLVERTAVEVGNIFTLGTRFSEPLELTFTDEAGQEQLAFMGCYGMGPSRLMGLLAEHFADDQGLVWPTNVAPAIVVIDRLGETPAVVKEADSLYKKLQNEGLTVLYDDRDLRVGEKLADAELLGIPYRVIVSEKTLEIHKFELKSRTNTEVQMLGEGELIKTLASAKMN